LVAREDRLRICKVPFAGGFGSAALALGILGIKLVADALCVNQKLAHGSLSLSSPAL
jgi:hypothetical protein